MVAVPAGVPAGTRTAVEKPMSAPCALNLPSGVAAPPGRVRVRCTAASPSDGRGRRCRRRWRCAKDRRSSPWPPGRRWEKDRPDIPAVLVRATAARTDKHEGQALHGNRTTDLRSHGRSTDLEQRRFPGHRVRDALDRLLRGRLGSAAVCQRLRQTLERRRRRIRRTVRPSQSSARPRSPFVLHGLCTHGDRPVQPVSFTNAARCCRQLRRAVLSLHAY
jgi:hypothetical protein